MNPQDQADIIIDARSVVPLTVVTGPEDALLSVVYDSTSKLWVWSGPVGINNVVIINDPIPTNHKPANFRWLH